ncbi:porin [Lysobacter sp. CA199]|uniref:porin n=1 Tax=Lysobacter sp. CA199 TaxID=3455608 RepID=UPI003F8CF844
MKKTRILTGALLAAMSLSSMAADLSYTSVEGGYAKGKQDVGAVDSRNTRVEDVKADGYYLKGSVALGDAFYVFGGYGKISDDDVRVTSSDFVGIPGSQPSRLDIDQKQYQLGLGYHHGLSERVDLVTELSYLKTELDTSAQAGPPSLPSMRYGVSSDGDDFRVAVGVRGNLAPNFEGWIKATYTDGDFYDSQFGGNLGVLVKFNETWGVTGEADISSDNRLYTVGLRASF